MEYLFLLSYSTKIRNKNRKSKYILIFFDFFFRFPCRLLESENLLFPFLWCYKGTHFYLLIC